MLVIYHRADLDGITSAAIVKKYYDHSYPGYKKDSLVLFGIDYGESLPNDLIKSGEKTFIVDFSFPMPTLHQYAQIVGPGNLIWCDHHKTSILEFKTMPRQMLNFVAVLPESGNVSACELIWAYLFPQERTPMAVKLLGKYDTWRNENKSEWEKEILPFQYGMRSLAVSPESFPQLILELFGETTKLFVEIMSIGTAILKYQEMQDEYLCKRIAFGGKFCGLDALFINATGFSSNSWKSIYDPSRHKILVSFHYTGQHWKYSLRAGGDEKVDCSELAAIYGGGGHRAAASFRHKLPAEDAPFYSSYTQ